LDSLYDLKDFGVWACSKVLQDGVYQVCGEFDFVHTCVPVDGVAGAGVSSAVMRVVRDWMMACCS